MNHKGCGGQIFLVATNMFTLVSPSMTITTKGIVPGVLELTSKKGGGFLLQCSKCDEVFSSKTDFDEQLIDKCSCCGEEKSPSDLLVSDMLPRICHDCKQKRPSTTKTDTQNRLLLLYHEYFKNAELPTLLTILCKPINNKQSKGEI